jgi:hypothetical protein
VIWLLAACEPAEVREARCQGPLVELVRWRSDRFRSVPDGPPPASATPDSLLREERDRVETAVAALRAAGSGCDTLWRTGLWTEPDTPPLRLRDEALRRVLGLPVVDYDVEAVGFSRQTTAGRPGVARE